MTIKGGANEENINYWDNSTGRTIKAKKRTERT